MKHKLLASDAGERTFILVLDTGDEAFRCITDFVEREGITAASIMAIGAFRAATIAFFEFETKNYRKIPVEVQSEVLSMIGDVAVDDEGKPSLHLHVVLGFSDGSTKGGHFLEGHVRPTLEVVLRETPSELRRRHRPDLGIALIDGLCS
ncbi:PPC domain-containing DNA-binding protein [Shinella sp. HZN7]|jgi:predicted DNA-binding protein with PD1-like motif|uniref:PPC domain-containing DNA-binding protein n=1 Tax=Shinella sp. (strain HZN7) TaxID=879274 RepID=UPI0007DA6B55|nr:PPC domain-containing DNA-binding protein [Shinella sp. HZN7]ANH08838.1 DNA-binding protein with PD1-like DNA-binding motif [Shinella sp. HZN7]